MGPKKPKKSKAELEAERLAREEEERKQRLQEEKRQAEEAEKRRLEDLRIQAERKDFRTNELERLDKEYNELLDDLRDKQYQRIAEEKEEKQKLDWLSYKSPSDEPDASSERDMNTLITLTNELDVRAFPETLDVISRLEKVAAAMNDYWSDCASNQVFETQKQAFQYLSTFSSIIFSKLDAAAAHCLRFADQQLNDKSELNVEQVATNASMGMWATFSENRPVRKDVSFVKVGVRIVIQKQLLNQERFIFRVIRSPIDTFSGAIYVDSESSIPGNRFFIVGDIMQIDLLRPSPAPFTLRAKKWVIRDNSSQFATPEKEKSYPSTAAACQCFLKVPDEVIMSDDIRICVWNSDAKDWVEDGLTDYQYSDSTRLVQFYYSKVGIFALVKNRVVDFPYRRWSLGPIPPPDSLSDRWNELREKCARFTVETLRHEVIIDVYGSTCRLIKPDVPEVADLLTRDLTPGQLVRSLLHRGINIFPVYADSKRIENNVAKNELLEDDVLSAIARCASAIDFESSVWNKELPEHQVGILARESTVSTGQADAFDFDCILAEMDSFSESHRNAPGVGQVQGRSGVKYTLVMGNDYGARRHFSHVPRHNEITHVRFSKALDTCLTEEAKTRIDRGNERFHSTVYKLLKLVKPFSF